MDELTTETEVHALDRALVAISGDPAIGERLPGANIELLEYADELEDVRVLYFVTALRTVVICRPDLALVV